MINTVSRIAFFLYVVFMLVGSTMPFQDPEPEDIAVSNPINQVVDSVIPLVCLLCLWPKRRQALAILKQEKYLVLFLAWCAITVIWSGAPLNSAKASVRMIGSTIVALSFFVNARSSEEALKYIRAVLLVYIPATFLAIALVPGATQWEWPAWRGLARHKNTLGEIALLSAIVWTAGMRENIRRRGLWAVFGAASLVLLFGSKSATALVTLLLIVVIALYLRAVKWAGSALTNAAAGSCCVLGLLVLSNVSSVNEAFAAFGKDATFTGRTDIWEAVIDEAKTHPFLGAGFGGFWTADRDLTVSDGTEWRPTTGHQGYLDLLNETGIIGMCLLALMVIFYFRNAARLEEGRSRWKLIFIAVLIVNTMESTLFRSGNFAGWMLVLSYLALYTDLTHQEARPQTATGSRAWPAGPTPAERPSGG